jgi:hypothetical protein
MTYKFCHIKLFFLFLYFLIGKSRGCLIFAVAYYSGLQVIWKIKTLKTEATKCFVFYFSYPIRSYVYLLLIQTHFTELIVIRASYCITANYFPFISLGMYVYDRGGPHSAPAPRPSLIYFAYFFRHVPYRKILQIKYADLNKNYIYLLSLRNYLMRNSIACTGHLVFLGVQNLERNPLGNDHSED